MARLKVFTTQSGFYDLAVAVTSQARALEAWGIHQNLFAEGMAKIATDQATVQAALAKPGMVLRRPLGTRQPFSEEPPLPKVKGGRPKARTAKKKKDDAARKAAERRERAAAEKHERNLTRLEQARAALEEKIAAERKALSGSGSPRRR